MTRLFTFLFIINYSLEAFSASYPNLPESARGIIIAYLHSLNQDIKTVEQFRILELEGKISKEISHHFRIKSPFGVRTTAGAFLLFDEALRASIPIHKFNSASFALSKCNNGFYKYAYKKSSCPMLKQAIKNSFSARPTIPNQSKVYNEISEYGQFTYRNKLNLASLLKSLPKYDTPEEKLASILIELQTWEYIESEIIDQIHDQIRSQVGQAWYQNWLGVQEIVRLHFGSRLRERIVDGLWDNLPGRMSFRILKHVEEQVKNQDRFQVKEQVSNTLQYFQFATALKEGTLEDAVKPAIDYVIMVYQLVMLKMFHSEAFNIFHADLSQYMLKKRFFTAENYLKTFDIPNATEGNYFIETNLKILKRHFESD